MSRSLFGVSVVVILILAACSSSVDRLSENIVVSNDTLLIELPASTSANLIHPAIWQDESNEWLATYNYLDHSLSIVNLTTREYFTQIKLQELGSHFVDPVNGMAYFGGGKLLLSSLKYLTVINYRGEVLERIRLNGSGSDIKGFDFTSGRLDVIRNSGLQLDSTSGEILLGAVQKEGNRRFQKYVASLHVSTRSVHLTAIPEFESHVEGERFGNLNGFNFTRFDGGLIVNPRYSSELAVLKDKVSHFYINSVNTPNKSVAYNRQGSDFTSIVDHQVKTVEFYPVFNLKEESLLLRIHRGVIDEITQKKPFFMTIADYGFKKQIEIPFPENYYISPILSKDGVMFMAFNKHDDKLELIRYKFTR